VVKVSPCSVWVTATFTKVESWRIIRPVVLGRAGILIQTLHLRDLAVELRNLSGQPVDLIDGLRNCLSSPDWIVPRLDTA